MHEKPKIYAFIPSRMGSERFRAKPLALINGKPMIQHVYERAAKAKGLKDIFVATDNLEIAKVVESFGGKAIITKESHKCGTDRIHEAAQIVGLLAEDIVINIQGDQPAFHPSVLECLVEPFFNSPQVLMTTLCFPVTDPKLLEDPNIVKVVVDHLGFALYFSRSCIPFKRSSNPAFRYLKHLGFYAYKRSFLETFANLPEGRLEATERLEQLRALENGYKILVVESPYDSLEVDVPSDLEEVERYLEENPWL